jgi:hypothetical protein
MDARDGRLIEAIASFADAKDGLRVAQRMGLLEPAWLDIRNTTALATIKEFAVHLNATQYRRQHLLMQSTVRELNNRKDLYGSFEPRTLALPAVRGVISAADVRRLRGGDVVVIDTHLIGAEHMRRVHADLLSILRSTATPSSAPCNTGAQSTWLPSVPGQSSWPDDFVSPDTKQLLLLLAALPAELERHGWPRPLSIPGFVQLACYSASNKAHYRPHLDRQPWEDHNPREITILLYVNPDWRERCGGCLRIHPKLADKPPSYDIEPLTGRLVLFQCGVTEHEVLPCYEGERLALTLWVNYLDGKAKAKIEERYQSGHVSYQPVD